MHMGPRTPIHAQSVHMQSPAGLCALRWGFPQTGGPRWEPLGGGCCLLVVVVTPPGKAGQARRRTPPPLRLAQSLRVRRSREGDGAAASQVSPGVSGERWLWTQRGHEGKPASAGAHVGPGEPLQFQAGQELTPVESQEGPLRWPVSSPVCCFGEGSFLPL